MECCGKPRSSRFCPDCGKALQAGGLWDLVRHLRQQARLNSQEVDVRRKQIGTEVVPGWLEAKIERKQELADKWQGWADELTKLLEDR